MVLILPFIAIIFSVLAFGIAAFSLIEIKAMQRSTHKITFYDPKSQEFTQASQAEKDALSKEGAFDDF